MPRRGPYASSRSTREAILAAVRDHPGLTRAGIARATGRSWNVVRHHVQGLLRGGEVVAVPRGRRTTYVVRPERPR